MESPLSHHARPGQRPRILCVDDEPHVLEGLRDTLRRSYDVEVAAGGADGLALLRADRHRYAVVLSDIVTEGVRARPRNFPEGEVREPIFVIDEREDAK